MICPKCNSENTVKNGHIHNGKQKFMCKACGRQFVPDPGNKIISQETKELIDRLLLEKISLAGIARSTDVSERWLQYYINDKYQTIHRKVTVTKKKKGRLTIECDEMWSFVGSKDCKYWIWLAKDIDTKEIVGCHIGSRDCIGAAGLWDSLPGVYRQCAVCYTDFWSAYENIFPYKRHRAVGKGSGKTNNIESMNSTMRQRISRLVRKTLSFSKKIGNHIGAIWNFIHYYNASLA
jgi:insertion element IS1 protein InsB